MDVLESLRLAATSQFGKESLKDGSDICPGSQGLNSGCSDLPILAHQAWNGSIFWVRWGYFGKVYLLFRRCDRSDRTALPKSAQPTAATISALHDSTHAGFATAVGSKRRLALSPPGFLRLGSLTEKSNFLCHPHAPSPGWTKNDFKNDVTCCHLTAIFPRNL